MPSALSRPLCRRSCGWWILGQRCCCSWCWAGNGCCCRDWLWRRSRAWGCFHYGCWWLGRLLSWALLGQVLNGTDKPSFRAVARWQKVAVIVALRIAKHSASNPNPVKLSVVLNVRSASAKPGTQAISNNAGLKHTSATAITKQDLTFHGGPPHALDDRGPWMFEFGTFETSTDTVCRSARWKNGHAVDQRGRGPLRVRYC